ncbi:hypothetical protein Taro_017644 [Colocasia esculenta]|uniref:Retrotransposon gag domain-containing protein n=1 Tax=Colocasia esculenta TaxID=4460 RepID=A0A843UTU7_COLES|nr:hypothetical protein [Colocasia esculenta]
MQGLVQAMQTQAHTQAALQAQLETQERADVWWASLLRTRFEDGAIDVAWDEFVRLFQAKFVPEHVQDRMEQEFLSLAQGSMTVALLLLPLLGLALRAGLPAEVSDNP